MAQGDVTVKQGVVTFAFILGAVFLLRYVIGDEVFIQLSLWVFHRLTAGLVEVMLSGG